MARSIPFAWFAQGLRLVDFADPYAPREVGYYMPDPAPGAERPSSNDVTVDDRGLVYLVDRVNGVDIIETSAFRKGRSPKKARVMDDVTKTSAPMSIRSARRIRTCRSTRRCAPAILSSCRGRSQRMPTTT